MKLFKLYFVTVLVFAVLFAGCDNRSEPQQAEKQSSVKTAEPNVIENVEAVWLDELDVSFAMAGWGKSKSNKSVDGNPLRVGGVEYERGVGTHAPGQFNIQLGGAGRRFSSLVGVDDEIADSIDGKVKASVEFVIIGDKEMLWRSGEMKAEMAAKEVDIDISGVELLSLRVTEGDNNAYDHADWVNGKIEYVATKPVAVEPVRPEPYILTPKPGKEPRITGARIFGVRAGNPFLFAVTATGERPMKFGADGLPEGLVLDVDSGLITGKVEAVGEYKVKVSAENGVGKSERELKIVVGDQICLTPPMGWNSWNCWGCAVDEDKIRAAADSMVDSGLVNHGWTYINIDDCWMIKPESDDPVIGGPVRDENGMLRVNKRFGDMKELTDYIHSLGLKAGTYISPGPYTCQRFVGSYEHEFDDAVQFAVWGFDYLKYDWCGYSQVSKGDTLDELKKPYILMREALDKVDRDIVYSLCQYGWGDVWTWGGEVGGNLWRTTGDIYDAWGSMAGIGFSQDKCSPYAGPGKWNDPDMLVVGKVGWGPNLHDSNLTPDEQYTHISLWCLLSAPLLIGCDLSDMDEFTFSLLTNDEVLDVDQDPLGQQAIRVAKDGPLEVWAKDMEDGSKVVGLFNRDDFETRQVTVDWSVLGIEGKQVVRDLWRQKDIGESEGKFGADVPVHGVVLVKIGGK